MLCPPTLRPASPAESEISVGGAPSPLPHHRNTIDLLQHQHLIMQQHAAAAAAAGLTRSAVGNVPEEYFQPFKRLRMSAESNSRDRTPSPTPSLVTGTTATAPSQPPPPTTTTAKSHIEGVKSFSIADILGHEKRRRSSSPPSSPLAATAARSGMIAAAAAAFQPRADLTQEIVTGGVTHPGAAAILLPGSQIVRPWDHLLGPMPVRPFIPQALLHYEHRLALDYHRQLQEHFSAQAQLLRHMGMETLIPSESGSERSSSAASDCCSPEIAGARHSADVQARSHSSPHGAHTERDRERQSSSATSLGSSAGTNTTMGGSANSSGIGASSKTKPNGTPLDALFQMTTKDFSETEGKRKNYFIFRREFATFGW